MVRSLFVVALPRSLSTLVHGCCVAALGLRSPAWTSAGEILNPDRFLFGGGGGEGARFVMPEQHSRFAMLHALLDDAVAPHGAAYKDVLQPFAVAAWLRDRDLAVLRIRRPVADVGLAMTQRGWFYPADATGTPGSPAERLLRGLLRAESALDEIPGETVEFDELLADADVLQRALERLYPGVTVSPLSYRDPPFQHRAQEVLARRSTAAWRDFAALAADVQPASVADRPGDGECLGPRLVG